jgi:hypothetical protein
MRAFFLTVAVLVVLLPAAFFLLCFDTQYAPGYSERAFKSIKIGETAERVLSRIGQPFSTNDTEPYVEWIYSGNRQPHFSDEGIGSGTNTIVTFKHGLVDNINGQSEESSTSGLTSTVTISIGPGSGYLKLTADDVTRLKGATEDQIRKRFGPPTGLYEFKASHTWRYSRPSSKSNYYLRVVGFDDEGKVVHVWHSIYWD